jgi:hypothetical protein
MNKMGLLIRNYHIAIIGFFLFLIVLLFPLGFNSPTGFATSENSCVIHEISYNPWADGNLENTLQAGNGDSVFTVSLGDGSCSTESVTFYVYKTYFDGTGYYTENLVDTLTGTVQHLEEDNLDFGYAPWTASWPGTDTYYYFIGEINGNKVEGDTLLVCENIDSCVGESITIEDISINSGIITEEIESTESVTEVEEIILDCPSLWDCSNLEWSDCSKGIKTRDLDFCSLSPNINNELECWNQEYLPESKKECLNIEDSYECITDSDCSRTEECIDNECIEIVQEEEVPFWNNFSIILLLVLLSGYYILKNNQR